MVAAASDRIPRVPPYSGAVLVSSRLPVRGFHPPRPAFPGRSGSLWIHYGRSYNPGAASTAPVWALWSVLQPRRRLDGAGLGSSRFARHYSGNRCFFLLLQVLRCFSSLRSPQTDSLVTGLRPAGLPHSDMRGSIPACGSPRLFAACHVLPRLRKPRHPPSALVTFSLF